jgi:hypothetical protein
MIERFIYLYTSICLIDPKEAFEKSETQLKWQEYLEKAHHELPLLKIVLPILTLTAQWVQVLSASDSATSSLVRLACKRIQSAISELNATIDELAIGTRGQKELAVRVRTVSASLQQQFDSYLGEHYSDFWAFRVAEFLDPRTHKLVSIADRNEAIKAIFELCTNEERTSEDARAKEKEASTRKSSRKQPTAAAAAPTAEMDAEDQFFAELGGAKLSTTVSIHEELKVFLNLMQQTNISDPLAFWSAHHTSLPIVFRIARRVVPARSSSTDVERLFSLTGRICSPTRSSLKPAMVNKLACMNLWLREELDYDKSNRKAGSKAASSRFVTLSANLVLVAPTIPQGDDDESDSDME